MGHDDVANRNYQPDTTPELVARAHDAGLAVILWTANDSPPWPR